MLATQRGSGPFVDMGARVSVSGLSEVPGRCWSIFRLLSAQVALALPADTYAFVRLQLAP